MAEQNEEAIAVKPEGAQAGDNSNYVGSDTGHATADEAPAAGKSLAETPTTGHQVPLPATSSTSPVAPTAISHEAHQTSDQRPPTSSPAVSSSASATAAAESSPTGPASPTTAVHFVAPSSYLRPLVVQARAAGSSQGSSVGVAVARPGTSSSTNEQQVRRKRLMTALDREQNEGLRAIRAFLKVRTSYDVLPLSYRLIVLDTSLLVKKSLNILTQTGIVSAPLWDSKTSTFAGLLTTSDYLNVVQYYWQKPEALAQIDQFRLNSLRDIERAIGVAPIETVSINPHKPLYEACRRMLESRARRIPLVDVDDETQREMVVSVVTQYRILKFVSVNVKETQALKKPLRDLKVGSYDNLETANMDTPVMNVIQQLVNRNISCVPILDPKDGTVLNVFEAVDVIALIKGGDYDNLNLTVGKALEKRSEDFPGIYTCTLNDRLDTIFDTIRKSRVHRLVVIDENSQLKGLLSLSDILDYTLNSPLEDYGR